MELYSLELTFLGDVLQMMYTKLPVLDELSAHAKNQCLGHNS